MDGDKPDEPPGLTPAELHRRVSATLRHRPRRDIVGPQGLRRWMVAEGFAEATPAGLVPTSRTLEVGAALDEIRPGAGRE